MEEDKGKGGKEKESEEGRKGEVMLEREKWIKQQRRRKIMKRDKKEKKR